MGTGGTCKAGVAPSSMAGRAATKPPSLLWRLVAALPTLLVLALLGWAALFLWIAPEFPDTDTLFADSEQRTVTLLAADDAPLAERAAENGAYLLERLRT